MLAAAAALTLGCDDRRYIHGTSDGGLDATDATDAAGRQIADSRPAERTIGRHPGRRSISP